MIEILKLETDHTKIEQILIELGLLYTESHQYQKARKTFMKVLKRDKFQSRVKSELIKLGTIFVD